ncbi:hypothetical protein [Sphingobacterium faecium]|uniref:hypothetical protein n=1 Tax=Sphingobacterium faecium TaxID=34087 RepID=UPI001292A34E|nr:hypothetical protein [Sphingobacterium faecium]
MKDCAGARSVTEKLSKKEVAKLYQESIEGQYDVMLRFNKNLLAVRTLLALEEKNH